MSHAKGHRRGNPVWRRRFGGCRRKGGAECRRANSHRHRNRMPKMRDLCCHAASQLRALHDCGERGPGVPLLGIRAGCPWGEGVSRRRQTCGQLEFDNVSFNVGRVLFGAPAVNTVSRPCEAFVGDNPFGRIACKISSGPPLLGARANGWGA